MTQEPFEYDVALSFAVEDRTTARDLARLLGERDIKVFLDEYKPGDPWQKDVVDHLINLYDRKARYCILFLSPHYPLQSWTEEERASATEAALRDADEYIIPLRMDDTDFPGLQESSKTPDLRRDSLEHIAKLIEGKLADRELHPGPPPESHDLRSGNVPSTNREEGDS